MKQPATGEKKAVDKASPKLMTGKVLQVNAQAKTFTVITAIDEGGKQFTFNAGKVTLPKRGDIIDITYTEPPGGGPLYTENHNSSRSNKTFPSAQ